MRASAVVSHKTSVPATRRTIACVWLAHVLFQAARASASSSLSAPIQCSGSTACSNDVIDNTSALYCDGLSACSNADVGTAGYVQCISTQNYACYGLSVDEIVSLTNLSCVGPYACKQAVFGSIGGDAGQIICQGYDACLNMVVNKAPP